MDCFISFELKDDGFSVDFVSLYDEECRIIASFARNSINEPLIPKMGGIRLLRSLWFDCCLY